MSVFTECVSRRGVAPGIPLTSINALEYSLLDWVMQINTMDGFSYAAC